MDLEQVTLAQMRYAIAVEAAESFRAAASRCHVSQSGLSMQVRKLEDLLGVVLFDRSRKPVLVTPEGAAALAQMRAVLRETERLGQIVAEEDEPSGRYRLGVIPTLSPTVLPLFLADFVDAYPRVELVIEELKTEEIIARLRADTLDAGLAATPLDVPGLAEEVLGLEGMLAYLPAGDPLLGGAAISQRELRGRELWVMPEGHCFRSQVLAYCSTDAPPEPRRIHFESGSFQTLIRLVDRGLGATVLPALVVAGLATATQRAQVRPLVDPTPVREIGLVTARADLRRQVTSALVGLARRRLSEALAPAPAGAVTLAPLAS
ncbi:MAG: DNA-binding transcriptional regulator OxyR [Deltaproteobacteria bacterium HGW-Deltaproteobacteria-14]|jgi:LysR family hydrogen peroxide-inducible transcriptional activator|nr:MAG: DNA-binding transcriptional regulator OxyR [Deltaproteobacteria bacterium HGW-Deltaproteobacteria-14]